MKRRLSRVSFGILIASLAVLCSRVEADSVAQIATGVRISKTTATLIDPQGRPGGSVGDTDTAARVGDILTFITHFTPVPNGGIRGLGGYVTVYVPRNTEVVGVRIIDAAGNTQAPRRAGFAADGCGPRGCRTYAVPLVNGSLAQLYADTGVFYATDARTTRVPDGSQAGEEFLTIFNGIAMVPAPTAGNALGTILGAPGTQYAHNQWDWIQALAFGVGDAQSINTQGTGNTADKYGSPVAGPLTWYDLEASYTGNLAQPIVVDNVEASGTQGPWQRIRTYGAETGKRGNLPPMPDPGLATRLGVPAVDNAGVPLGVSLDPSNPLPAFDAASPGNPYTRALRFAVGELLVGVEYLSEFSLRVLDTPLDPVAGADIVCAEVFGGDASAEELNGTKDGKDNSWRYFVPATACVSLNLLFDLDVSATAVLQGSPLTYTLGGKNLSTAAHTNVQIRHCYIGGDLTFVSATGGGVDQAATGCPATHNREVLWTIADWQPGAEFSETVDFTAAGGPDTIGRAIFTSDQLPAPGFSTVAYTVIDDLSIIGTDLTVNPAFIASKPSTVTYTATVTNSGTATATLDNVVITLPASFTYTTGTAKVGGAGVADPAVNGSVLTFTGGLPTLPAGGSFTLTFDVVVEASATDGLQVSAIDVRFTDPFKGEKINDSRIGMAHLAVVMPFSAVPTVDDTLLSGGTKVSGTTAEAAGTTIRVFISGLEIGTTTSDATGKWQLGGLSLFGGQRISASAEATGKLESARSAEVTVAVVTGIAACNDGVDNDGDGKTDFPDDPDCSSGTDPEETHTPACADGADNDGDGDIDFGSDPGCASLLDDEEAGGPACGDAVDNDGDGKVDFGDDPGCSSTTDVDEADAPGCADGLDNDGDGDIDFPRDDGCDTALDDDEEGGANAGTGGAGGNTDAGIAGVGGMGGADSGEPGGDGSIGLPDDPGGIDEPHAGSAGGCGCRIAARPTGSSAGAWFVLASALLLVRSRRRALRARGR